MLEGVEVLGLRGPVDQPDRVADLRRPLLKADLPPARRHPMTRHHRQKPEPGATRQNEKYPRLSVTKYFFIHRIVYDGPGLNASENSKDAHPENSKGFLPL